MQLHGAQPQRNRNADQSDKYQLCRNEALPYVDDKFAGYRNKSVQDFRFALSEGIRSQVVFATFVEKVENQIKSTSVINALKQAFSQNMSHL